MTIQSTLVRNQRSSKLMLARQARHARLAVLLLLSALASPAMANMVWPAVYLQSRLFTWWAIGLGLLIEFFAIRAIYKLTWRRSAIATVSANVGSTALGIVLIPLAGLAWEFFPGIIYNGLLGWGTFNPVTWIATFIIACLINALIEGLVLKFFFRLTLGHKRFWLLAAANSISVGIAFASLFLFAPQL